MDKKIPDNFNKDFPARMSDGRFITDYTRHANTIYFQQNEQLIQNFNNSWY